MHQVKGFIQIYSKKARDQVTDAGQKFLGRAGLDVIWPELFACVDELIKNAVKANYKFLLVREQNRRQAQGAVAGQDPRGHRRGHQGRHQDPGRASTTLPARSLTSTTFRHGCGEILNQESKLLGIKNRAYAENRHYTEGRDRQAPQPRQDKRDTQEGKGAGHQDTAQGYRPTTISSISRSPTPRRSWPRTLVRIHEKRDEYRPLQGRRPRSTSSSSTTSTPASPGSDWATPKIDSILADWGLADERAITIISAINTTVMLTLPVDLLKQRFVVASHVPTPRGERPWKHFSAYPYFSERRSLNRRARVRGARGSTGSW